MIIVVEPIRLGLEHLAFNTALLQTVLVAFPDDCVEFWADSSHLAAIAEELGSEPRLTLRPVKVAPRRASLWQRRAPDLALAKAALVSSGQGNKVIFSSISIPLLWACRFWHGADPAFQIGCVLHGGLAELRWRPKFNLWKRWTGLRWAMSVSPKWLSFWVLEQSIADALPRFAPEVANRFAVFPHPLPPDLVEIVHEPPQQPLAIGLLGLATPQKGLLRFLNVATELRGRGAEFHLVGRIHQDWRVKVASQLTTLAQQPETEPMPRPLFVERARRLTYGAFFFDGEHYSLTASGVLLDCIALGIPLLGCRHPLFTALEAEVGEIGHFCQPGEEVAMVEQLITGFDPTRHRQQSEAMLRLREPRMLSALAERLKGLLVPR